MTPHEVELLEIWPDDTGTTNLLPALIRSKALVEGLPVGQRSRKS